ncbi:hypothetical protein AALC16_23615 [Lachnospiraceae bacterium 29-91]
MGNESNMVEMAGKEYLLKLRAEQEQIKNEILKLLHEKGQLSFQEIYINMERKYRTYSPFSYGQDVILEGVMKNQMSALVNKREVMEISTGTGVEYRLVGKEKGQEVTHAA